MIEINNDILIYLSQLEFALIKNIHIEPKEIYLLYLLILSLIYYLKTLKLSWFLCFIIPSIYFLNQLNKEFKSLKNQRFFIAFSVYPKHALAFIQGQQAFLVSNIPADKVLQHQLYNFKIKPTLNKLKINHVIYVHWEQDYNSRIFNKKKSKIVFQTQKIHLINTLDNPINLVLNHFNIVYLNANNQSLKAISTYWKSVKQTQ